MNTKTLINTLIRNYMFYKLKIICLVGAGYILPVGYVFGQSPPANKPVTQVQVGAISPSLVRDVPSAYSQDVKINYVKSRDALGPVTDEAAYNAMSYINETTQYLDGLGRPLQTVVRQASPTGKDLVSPMIYDAYGRPQFQYLPYVSTSSDGKFKLDAFNEQKTFMQATYPGEQVYYGKTVFESSPLNRTLKTFEPVNSWAGSEGSSSEKSVQLKNMVNSTSDAVRIWNISFDPLNYTSGDATINIPQSSAVYNAGELQKNVVVDEIQKNVVVDENGNAVVEYRDKEGQVILKKVQAGSIASDYSGYDGFLSTYYMYDALNRLRFVVPPKAV